ncbi:MAG: tRNA pseudouridine(13) synthase TruD [Candidatus Diapherotrites archaeon CG08_land_8_20_14_0_20_34_12]|nr:MAG: tRNA pseudouridine(13) synthase TruD [Candidatus Diapherotrites archaeon CG08_land_8_20_14_0_20_34_12]
MTKYFTKCKGIGGEIKRRYSDFIVEEIQENGRICEVKYFTQENAPHEKILLPENMDNKEYLQFDLEKINQDMNFAIRIIARKLQISPKRIGYGGLKDKRGITCQRISIWNPNIKLLEDTHWKGLRLSNPDWEDWKLDLGKLKGNRFTVVIRNINLPKEEIEKRLTEGIKEINENGIANYYGEQRFGGIRNISHLVGKELIKEDVKNAVMLYLTATDIKEDEELRKARLKLAETEDFSLAIKMFPIKNRFERSMIHHLCKYPNDFAGAFSKMPKKFRFLFTHAFQGYLFNKIIDKRLELGLGLLALEGEKSEDRIAMGLLAGYESKFSDNEKIADIEKNLLEEENIKFEDFKLKVMAECSSKGAYRKLVIFPKDIKLIEIRADEFYEGKQCCSLSFDLEKSCYATVVLRELMKDEQ